MNLPECIEDLSLLEKTPLCNSIAVHKCTEGRRSSAKDAVSRFVEEMQQDGKAAAAAKEWARLIFASKGVLPEGVSFEVTDQGQTLYRVFFEYQCRLHRGKQDNFSSARQYEAHIVRSGLDIVKAVRVKDHRSETGLLTRVRGNGGRGKGHQHSSRPPGAKNASRHMETRTRRPDTGDRAARLNLRRGSHPTTNDSTMQQRFAEGPPYVAGARQSTLSEDRKRRTSKQEKKRRASSQKPPVITPSDASEDDKEPAEAHTHAVIAPGPMSHRSKRIAFNPPRQSGGLNRVDKRRNKTRSTHKAERNGKRTKNASIPQRQSPLASFTSDGFVSHSSIKGRRGAKYPLSRRNHVGKRLSTITTRFPRPRSVTRPLWMIKSVRSLQPPAKRIRLASMSARDRKTGERAESVHALSAPELTAKRPLVTGSLPSREYIQSKARKKRARLELETASAAFDESTSTNEYLGPDIRSFRPLPKKIRNVRLIPAVRGVPYIAPSVGHADQLLRDAASNGLALLHEAVGPEIPDWTQDKEDDAECDDPQGLDQDGVNNVEDTATAPAPTKPPVPAHPCIWAQSRQEVCESVDYFRCYHSGVYSKDDIVRGYLLGAHSASRDIFHHGGKLIISHGGGKSESIIDPRRGPKRYQTDQDQEASDKSVRALLKTYRDRRPIVLLADDKYALFPYDLTSGKYTYVVLGLYWISHAWAECQSARDGSGRIVRWKFAFQWCEGQGDPWWLPQPDTISHLPKSILMTCPTNHSSTPENTSRDLAIQCKNCQEHSPFVYRQGWMCLNPRCHLFWSINGEEPKRLDYCEAFLNLLPQKFERLPNIIPSKAIETRDGVTTTYAFSKGMHCKNCGRLSCRYKWEYWECANCNFKHVINGRVRSPKEFWHQRPPKGILHSQIGKDSGILPCLQHPINLGAPQGFTNRLTFILPYGRGKIHLILGTPLANRDADDIFRLYQQQASTSELKLRRYPLRNHRARGLLLTNYFSQNSGEPYQYVGGSGQTVSFSEAPECVRRALALIKERASLALHSDIPFNEILSAAYMERQKMSFHSDSEKGLGPIVASLSLGSAALMHFRPHVNVENLMPKGTHALTLVLRHGDVLIMEGDGVQKCYEHTVVPMNFRIAATARCIGTA